MKILGRPADFEAKTAYANAILNKNIDKDKLADLLMQSSEYILKAPVEQIKMPVPVKVDVGLNEQIIIGALQRSNIYWTDLRPKLDIGDFVYKKLEHLWLKVQEWFYENRNTMSLRDFIEKLSLLEKEPIVFQSDEDD